MLQKPQIVIPRTAKKGELIEIKTLITHLNERVTGEKELEDETKSKPLIHKFIREFTAEFEDIRVFHAKLTAKISSNPYISFYMKASKSGNLTFTWQENTGRSWTTRHHLEVS